MDVQLSVGHYPPRVTGAKLTERFLLNGGPPAGQAHGERRLTLDLELGDWQHDGHNLVRPGEAPSMGRSAGQRA